jgi:hypothetical protein
MCCSAAPFPRGAVLAIPHIQHRPPKPSKHPIHRLLHCKPHPPLARTRDPYATLPTTAPHPHQLDPKPPSNRSPTHDIRPHHQQTPTLLRPSNRCIRLGHYRFRSSPLALTDQQTPAS